MQVLITFNASSELKELQMNSIEQFQQEIKEIYNLSEFSLSYFDDEGDRINLGSQIEFDEAVEIARENGNFLSVVLEGEKQKEAEAPQPPKEELKFDLKNLTAPFLNLLGANSPLEPIVNELAHGAQQFLNQLEPEKIQKAARDIQEWAEEIPEMAQELADEIKESYEPEVVAKEEEKVLHRALCDNCEKIIMGVRYKCIQCDDFDLCEDCEGANSGHDATHVFAKLKTTEQTIPKPSKPASECDVVAPQEESEKEEPSQLSPKSSPQKCKKSLTHLMQWDLPMPTETCNSSATITEIWKPFSTNFYK